MIKYLHTAFAMYLLHGVPFQFWCNSCNTCWRFSCHRPPSIKRQKQKLKQSIIIGRAGHGKYFLSPQSTTPQLNFNFLNLQPQVRNDSLGFLSPQPQVCNFVILEVRKRKSVTFYKPSGRVLIQPCPEVVCSELISKHKSKVVTCGKYWKRMVGIFHAIKRITHNRW